MSDPERNDRRLVLTQRSSPWWRAAAVVVGVIVLWVCIGFFLEADFREDRGNVLERLAGVVVAMVAVVGASSLIWGLFAPDRTMTFDGLRRVVEVVERRPFRRARTVTRSFVAVASVDVVPEVGDEADTVHLHLALVGEDRPLVVRTFLERSEADTLAARLRDLLRR